MRFLSLVSPPAVEPISLVQAKQHLRVDIDDDNDLINDYISTAREWIEITYGRALITQTWDYILDGFPLDGSVIELPRPPLVSVSSIIYTNNLGVPTTWASTNYQVDNVNEPGQVSPTLNNTWPTTATLEAINGVAIRFVAGYGAAGASVPFRFRTAIRLLVGHWYENREPVMAMRGVTPIEIPFTVQALLRAGEIAGVS